jgi:predicted nucleic acid-binding protein
MDTNHVTAWEAQSPALVARIKSLSGNTLIFASAITLGEMSAGHEMTSGDAQRRHKVRNFLNIYVIPYALPVTHSTESYYGQIIGRILEKKSSIEAKHQN